MEKESKVSVLITEKREYESRREIKKQNKGKNLENNHSQ